MKKEDLLKALKQISDTYFHQKDYINAGRINIAIEVVEEYDGVLPQPDVIKSVCDHSLKIIKKDGVEYIWCTKCLAEYH